MKDRGPVPRLPLRVALKRSIAVSAVAFALLMAVLTVRMAAGDDPALGPKIVTQTPEPAPLASTGEDGEEDEEAAVAVVVQSAPPSPATQPAPAPAPVQTTTS